MFLREIVLSTPAFKDMMSEDRLCGFAMLHVHRKVGHVNAEFVFRGWDMGGSRKIHFAFSDDQS
jgi:hypothetical protein